ncbi:MAG: acyltransferase [Bacteroidota bacterium]
MGVIQKIKRNARLKQLVHWLMVPKWQARPRLWVKWFVNPFYHKKGKQASIRRRTRMDVLPWNGFELGDRSTIEDFSTVNNGVGAVTIGSDCRIGMGNTIIGPVILKDRARTAQNVVLSGLNHSYEDVHTSIWKQQVTVAPITVGEDTWIGANCTVVAGVTIGKHCVIAGGSVVTKNIPSYSVAVGNPARIIKQYNPDTGVWERVTRPQAVAV